MSRFYLLLSGAVVALTALAWQVAAPHPMAPSVPTGSSLIPVAALAPQKQFRHDNPVPAPEPASSPELSLERRCLALAERDPREALNFAIDSGLSDTAGLLENLTAQWAARDFAAAHAWVLEQDSGDWRDGLLARVAYAGSQVNPAAAARMVVNEIAPGPCQDEAVISVLHQWALSDPSAAAAWANAFPEGDLRKRALAEIEGIRESRVE